MMKTILIIEDEVPLAEALKYTLGREGYATELAHDGATGLELFERDGADLVLLDIMLPVKDGLEVCRTIRRSSSVPIIMVTAKDSDVDEILGLEMGADDYITKPFNARTLVTRIRAVLRRAGEEREVAEGTEPLEWGDIVMDRDKHEVTVRGEAVDLTPIEYALLELLLSRPTKVMPRTQILQVVWGDFYGSGKTLDVHVRHLREKIEEDPANPVYIQTVRGMGYKLGAVSREGTDEKP
jgi:two-component system, OmpR family, response regulator RegX3